MKTVTKKKIFTAFLAFIGMPLTAIGAVAFFIWLTSFPIFMCIFKWSCVGFCVALAIGCIGWVCWDLAKRLVDTFYEERER